MSGDVIVLVDELHSVGTYACSTLAHESRSQLACLLKLSASYVLNSFIVCMSWPRRSIRQKVTVYSSAMKSHGILGQHLRTCGDFCCRPLNLASTLYAFTGFQFSANHSKQ